MRGLLITLALSLSTSLPTMAQDASSGQADLRFSVPDTVSPTARTELQTLYSLFAAQPRSAPSKPANLAEWDARKAQTDAFVEPFMAQRFATLHATLSADRLGGVPVLRVRPTTLKPGLGPLIYIHGGAYTSLSANSTRANAALFATASGREVVSIDYTLAPHARWREVTDQVLAVWKALIANGVPAASMGMFGDSAGGGLAAGATLKMRDQGLPLPGALFLMSPWCDVTETGDTHATLRVVDPIIAPGGLQWSAEAYADPADQKNPYVSPVYGDYAKPFPPTLIQGGTHEVLLSDFVREYQAIRAGGHEAVLDLYEGMPHVFQTLAFDAPETRTSAERVAAFFDAHLSPLPARRAGRP